MPTYVHTLYRKGRTVDVPTILLQFGSPASCVGLLYWMLATGRLVTRREHENRIADKDQQVILWRGVGETAQAQKEELLEHSRLTVQLLTAIKDRADEQRMQGPSQRGAS